MGHVWYEWLEKITHTQEWQKCSNIIWWRNGYNSWDFSRVWLIPVSINCQQGHCISHLDELSTRLILAATAISCRRFVLWFSSSQPQTATLSLMAVAQGNFSMIMSIFIRNTSYDIFNPKGIYMNRNYLDGCSISLIEKILGQGGLTRSSWLHQALGTL